MIMDKESFINWISKTKLKHITALELAEIIENAFFTYLNCDVWTISDNKQYSELRQKLISNTSFKKQNKKAYKSFVAYGKHYQTFLKLNSDKDESSGIKETSEKEKVAICPSGSGTSIDPVIKEQKQIELFFNNQTLSALYLELFNYAKKGNELMGLDVRSSIIGVKVANERLRFYSDKTGIVHFKMSQNKTKIIELNFDNLLVCKEYIKICNSFFATHQNDVVIPENNDLDEKKYIYHVNFGFGFISEDKGNAVEVVFPDSDEHKILQKGHKSYFFISKKDYDNKYVSNELEGASSKRVLWDKYETAILIEGFWKLENREDSRRNIVSDLSKKLRNMALNKGMNIDEFYRNENGINIQLSNVALSFFPERSTMHRTAIFDEIAEVYKNNYQEFLEILEEAYNLICNDKVPSRLKNDSVSLDEADFFTFVKSTYAEKHKNDGKSNLATKVATKTISWSRKLNSWLKEQGYSVDFIKINNLKMIDTIIFIINDNSKNLDEDNVRWFIYVCNKYKAFLKQKNINTVLSDESTKSNINDNSNLLISDYVNVLDKYFQDGFAFENPLRKRRFISCYEDINSKNFEDSDSTYLLKIRCCGFIYDNKVYLSSIVSPKLRQYIQEYLNNLFVTAPAVYYSSVYDYFKDKLNPLFDVGMFKTYLMFELKDFYRFEDDFIRAKGKKFDLKMSMIDIFVNQGTALDKEELYNCIPTVSQQAIDEQLKDRDFIVNYRGKSYFYINVLYFEDSDLKTIESFIRETIISKEQLSGDELYSFLCSNLPSLIENNPSISELGFKNAIKYYLNDKFNFNGDVISNLGQEMDVKSLFAEFCSLNEKYTFNELDEFRKEIHKTHIDYDTVFTNSIRVDKNTFVRMDSIEFDIKKVDDAISKYCKNGFCSFNDIINYTDFPYIQYPWNEYILESYVYSQSKDFKLYHKCFNGEIPVGAIIDVNSKILSFDELLIAIIKQEQLFSKEKALSYLLENRYILTRKLKNIDYLISMAKKEI